VIGQLAAYLEGDNKTVTAAIAAPLQKNILPEQAKDLYQHTIKTTLLAGIQRMYEYIRNTYADACRPDDKLGLCHVPNGAAQYDRLLRFHLSDNTTTDEVYALAEEWYQEVSHELGVLAAAVGVTPTEVFKTVYARQVPSQYVFSSAAEVVEACYELADTVQLENVFLPEDLAMQPCSTNVITDRRAETMAAMYDNNVFSLPISDPKEYTTAYLQRLYVHEAVGHHIGISNHRQRTPPFLRDARYPAVTEGWAMYVESLANDMGLPELPAAARLWSYPRKINASVSMMLDIKVNKEGLTLEQARQFLEETLPGSDFERKGNLARLLAWPAQGHTYRYGERAFHALRASEQARLGNDFDLKKFHGSILAAEAPFNQLAQRLTMHT
jgi:uncharacterized protein (DUF885 family)